MATIPESAKKLLESDPYPLINLVHLLRADDDNLRKPARTLLNYTLENYPNSLIQKLVETIQCSSLTSSITVTLCYGLLRDILPPLWTNLSSTTRNELKSLACLLFPKHEWDVLFYSMFKYLGSNSWNRKFGALFLLNELIPKCREVFIPHVDYLIKRFMDLMPIISEDHQCGVFAAKATVKLIMYFSNPASYSKFYELLSQVLVIFSVALREEELVCSLLEDMIVLAGVETAFFEVHLDVVIMCMVRLAENLELGAKLSQLAVEFVVTVAEDRDDKDWKIHHAAVTAIGVISVGCSNVIVISSKNMEYILQAIVKLIRDKHPRVQWAVIQAIGRISMFMSPQFQQQYHQQVLPALIEVLDDFDNPRSQDNKVAERRSKGNSTINGAHIVEDDQKDFRKTKKFKGRCFNCGKIDHKSTDCCAPKKGKKKDQANMIESNKECDDLCAIFSEYNLVGNPREWWMDSGATRHVYANKELFLSFAPAQVEEMIYMANSAMAKVEGTGKVDLKMTLGKGEAILPAIRILSRVFHIKTQSIPYEKWKRRKPNLKYLKVWGCLAKVQVPMPKRVKIGPKTMDCIFIGYAKSSKVCRFLVHKSKHPDINENTVIESDNAEFFENIYPYKTRHEQSSEGSKRHRDEPSENLHNEENARRSTCQRTFTTFGSDFVTFLLENEPQTFEKIMLSSNSSFWKEAVNSEIDSILSNHTWELVDIPLGNKPLGSKWIFKRKIKADGTIDKYKARLIVKGFKQKEGHDYFDTYSPVKRITSIRMLISLAVVYGLEIHQMDMKTAFLNGELDEEIYMEQPEGFVVPGN
ncbi:hypothetical protein BC332_06605 [Capsicum chinense]|nr:hypothetical protein BC332_06605 [Capsicum chinense]